MSWPGQTSSSQGPPNPERIPHSQLYPPPPLAPIASIRQNVNLQRPLQPQPYYPYPPPRPESERQPEQHDTKRLRISRACDGCRRKKIRCYTTTPGQPCKNCVSSKIDCTYNDSAKKRGPPKGYIEVLENRLKRMERILSGLADEDDDNNTKHKHDTSRESTVSENERQQLTILGSSRGSSDSGAGPSNSTGRNVETASSEQQPKKEEGRPQRVSGFSSLSSSTMTRYVGDMSPLPFLAQKINFEDARVFKQIGFKVRKFGQSLVLIKENDSENGDASVHLLQKLGMLKPGETINSMNDWIFRVAGIDRATSDRLMKIYFAYIHPGLPILNKVLFLKQYRRELGDYPSPALLNGIYGAAARYIETCALFGDKPFPDDKKMEPMKGWSENLFENLLLYVRGPYSPCVATIQALVIGQFHRASLDERFASSWMLNSAATRMAQDLGLHRSSASWDIPDSEKETRRRVWWSVYIMDKWSSAATGRPQTIFDEDCDESYPSESATWEEVMDAPYGSVHDAESDELPRFPSLDKDLAKKAKDEKIPLYQPFVQLVKLSEILGRILQGLYTPRAKRHSAQHGSDAIVSYLDKSLSEWRSNLPPSLQISSTNVRRLDHRGHMPLLSMSGLMYLAYCTLLILLHRPFIENEQEFQRNKLSSSSLTICTNAATRLIDIAEKMHYRDFLLVSWNFALYPIFTAALIHIYNAASSDSIVSDVAKNNLVRSLAVIRRISKLSSGAGKLYEVLKTLVARRGITVEDLTDIEEASDASKKPVSRKRKRRPTQTKDRIEESNTSNIVRTSSLSPKVSDVRGGPQPDTSRRGTTASSTSDGDRAGASGGSTPTSVMNGEWLNGLYSGFEQQEPATATNLVNTNTQDTSDPYSLQQFGLPMGSMFPSVDQLQTMPSHQSQQRQQQQQQQHLPQTVGSMLLRLQSTDNFLFGFPDVGLSMDSSQQSAYTPSQPVVPSDAPLTQPLQRGNAAPTSSAAPMYMQSNDMSQTQFRYRPDNPFWSVPSTLELDDWTAYLLPQQQQQQQPQAQPQTAGSDASCQPQSMSWNDWV